MSEQDSLALADEYGIGDDETFPTLSPWLTKETSAAGWRLKLTVKCHVCGAVYPGSLVPGNPLTREQAEFFTAHRHHDE